MLFPKKGKREKSVKRLVDKKHLRKIAALPCCCCKIEDGTIVPHHLMKGVFRGVGRKADDCWTVPLCLLCHEWATENETELFEKYSINGKELAAQLYNG